MGIIIFTVQKNFNAYGLAGINFARAKTDAIDLGAFGSFPAVKTTETGLNVGAGVDLGLTNALRFFGELKYVISDADQLVATAGVKFAF